MSKKHNNIIQNKGDLKPREVEKVFNANGWHIVRSKKHDIYQKNGVPGSIPAPRGDTNWKTFRDICKRYGMVI